MRALLISLLLATVLISPVASAAREALAPRKALIGGWAPIKDVGAPHVREIGEYAVSEHNKEEKATLAFGRVVRGETQVVSGVKYRLVVEAKDGGAVADYEAVVWEKAWLGFRQLTSFELLKG